MHVLYVCNYTKDIGLDRKQLLFLVYIYFKCSVFRMH